MPKANKPDAQKRGKPFPVINKYGSFIAIGRKGSKAPANQGQQTPKPKTGNWLKRLFGIK